MTNDTTGLPRVVACMPAWNAAAFIEQTLESLAAQTYRNLEVLISDDASTDETPAICARFAATDARFRLIRQNKNLGWVGNVNALLRAAAGDYFLFASHDDLVKPTYVASLVAQLEANPQAILAFSDIEIFYPNGRREVGVYTALEGIAQRAERARRILGRQSDWWIPYRGIFRSIAAEHIGGLRRHLAGEFEADWPWLVHMSLLGEFIRVPEILCEKIYQERGLSLSWDYNVWSWAAVTLSCAREIRRSDLSPAEKLRLHGVILRVILRRYRHLLWKFLRHRTAEPGWKDRWN